jgi:hypothetical protein
MADETQVVDIAGQSVVIAYGAGAGVWYVHSSTVPGLTGEAASAAELIEELQVTVPTSVVTVPAPLHSEQVFPLTSPLPEQAGQRFSPDCAVPGLTSSPGFLPCSVSMCASVMLSIGNNI